MSFLWFPENFLRVKRVTKLVFSFIDKTKGKDLTPNNDSTLFGG